MKTIKNILVPTDFSANDVGAFQYAKSLAKSLEARIIVLHINPHFLAKPNSNAVDDEIQLQETISTFINTSENDEKDNEENTLNPNAMIHLLRGESLYQIIDMAQSKSIDLIVMSTKGMQDFLTKIKDSPSVMELMKKAFCPILIVPQNAKWSPIERVLLASSINIFTPAVVQEIAYFAQSSGTVIHFTHISEKEKEDNATTIKLWTELYEKSDVEFPHEIHTVCGESKMKRLSRYIHKKDINIVAFFNKQRHFWQNLFRNNLAEKIALSKRIPILLFSNFKVPRIGFTPKMGLFTKDYRMEGQGFFF
jgi:nucleotide-binding universal stress UspA family protein